MSVFPSRISLFSGAVALSLLASTAMATPISLVYDGSSVSNETDWEIATITAAPVDLATNDGRVYAFGFNMTDTTDTLGSFLAWCLDLGSFLSTSDTAQPYTITTDPFNNSDGLSPSEQARVQSVFDANFGTLDATDGVQAAGFQIALWNALYENDLDAQAGTFAVSATQDVINKANDYLTAANGYDDGQAYRLTFLESTPGTGEAKYQNLVTVSPVPLPAAGFLLLAALGGLGFAGRRRKAA